MNKLPKYLNVNDKAKWVRSPQEYGPLGTTLGQQRPRFRNRRTKEAKALRAKRRELVAACGGEPTAVQATLIEHICQQYADLQMYGFRKATEEEPVSEHQDQLAVALYNTHERYLQAFAKTLPPPAANTEDADKVVALIRGLSTPALAAMVKALEELDGEEVQERLEKNGNRVRVYIPDNGRNPRDTIREKLDGLSKRLAAGESVGESPMRAEPDPVQSGVEVPSANPDLPQRQEAAQKEERGTSVPPKLPPNVVVDEIKPPRPRAGARLWTGGGGGGPMS